MWERLEKDLLLAHQRINELENALRPLAAFEFKIDNSDELKRLLARAKLVLERKTI